MISVDVKHHVYLLTYLLLNTPLLWQLVGFYATVRDIESHASAAVSLLESGE